MPVLLLGCGLLFSSYLHFFWIVHPVKFFRSLKKGLTGGGQTPFKAMTVALAGTLGVGNIAGVASAIVAGGAGAVFWMWVSALLAMGVKYAEVALAVAHRRKNADGFFGGAMYYMSDMLSPRLGGFFALLCLANSLVTGNIVQSNAAAAVYSERIPPIAVGAVMCVLSLAVTLGSLRRISDVTVKLIPFLSGVYILLSLYIIFANTERLPGIFADIFGSAFSLKAAAGGAGGFALSRAVRFGVTRGILSNEAGCGTAPTAHASANTNSPHDQGNFGIFEVFADTVVICTLTAIVILLLGDGRGEDGVRLSVLAYRTFAGRAAGHVISVSVILFAYATVICQSYYGVVALRYLTHSRLALGIYFVLFGISCIAGSVIGSALMWNIADLCVSAMTATNVVVLLYAFFNKRERRLMLPGDGG